MILIAATVIVALVLIFIYASIRILREYERGVVFTASIWSRSCLPRTQRNVVWASWLVAAR